MTDLSEREKAFENKFKHDEEFKFKVNVRGVKIFGRWVAEQLGLSGTDAEAYAKSVVDSDFAEPGTGDVLRKVTKDVTSKGLSLSSHRLEAELNRCLDEAFSQLSNPK